MGGSAAETIRQPRDRLKGQPQERQHTAASWRDAGPTGPGEGCRICCAKDRHRMAETPLRLGARLRLEPGPASPDAL